jgi:hypothetical protein
MKMTQEGQRLAVLGWMAVAAVLWFFAEKEFGTVGAYAGAVVYWSVIGLIFKYDWTSSEGELKRKDQLKREHAKSMEEVMNSMERNR